MTTQPDAPAPKATQLKIDAKVELQEMYLRTNVERDFYQNRTLVLAQRLADLEAERNALAGLVGKQAAEIKRLTVADLKPSDPASDPALAAAIN